VCATDCCYIKPNSIEDTHSGSIDLRFALSTDPRSLRHCHRTHRWLPRTFRPQVPSADPGLPATRLRHLEINDHAAERLLDRNRIKIGGEQHLVHQAAMVIDTRRGEPQICLGHANIIGEQRQVPWMASAGQGVAAITSVTRPGWLPPPARPPPRQISCHPPTGYAGPR
jgi:hypothetical protein